MLTYIFEKIKLWHIVLCAALIYICALTPGISLNGDDSDYILMSRSFVDHGVLGHIYSSDIFAKGRYYIALPFVLMPFTIICPDNYLAMKLIPLASALLSIIVLYVFLKGILGESERKMVTILYAFNPWMALYSGLILTETLYLFISISALLFMKRCSEIQDNKAPCLGMGIISALSIYTRPFGLALTAALAISFMAMKKWKALIIFFILLSIILAPLILKGPAISRDMVESFITKKNYFDFRPTEIGFKDLMFRSCRNLLAYSGNYLPDIVARQIVENIYPRCRDNSINPLFLPKFFFGIILTFLIIIGYVVTLRIQPQTMHLYVILHLLINMAINHYVARFLLSILPFILLFLFAGLDFLGKRFLSLRKIVPACFTALLVISLAGASQNIVCARTAFLQPAESSFIKCNEWAKTHVKSDAVILSRKPSFTTIYTGCVAIGYLFIDDPTEQMRYINANNVSIVIVGDLGSYLHEAQYITHAIAAYPKSFKLLYTTESYPENYIYEVMR